MAFDLAADPPPRPPAANIPMVGPDGKPSRAWLDFHSRLIAWLGRVVASIP
jgi:hypothetical protein